MEQIPALTGTGSADANGRAPRTRQEGNLLNPEEARGAREEAQVAAPTYGRDLIRGLPRELRDRPLVVTQPEPWELVRSRFDPAPARLHFAEGMDHDEVSRITESLGSATAVFGIGGGSALDFAKFVAWSKGLPLVLVPSILSADAAFTRAIAVREGSRVRYVGEILPEALLIDYDLLSRAPRALNLSGVGDILSIFTALWDWKEAGLRLGEAYDPEIASASRGVLDRLLVGAPALRALGEEGLHLLAESYREEVALCERFGNARPEEGSEHYIAYCLEYLTKRHFLHGRLVSLCTLLAAHCQGQDTGPVRSFLEEVGLACSFAAVGTCRREMRDALIGMDDYIRQERQLLPGVFHFRGGIREEEADAVLDAVEKGTRG
jgi:glycerol-1-phosphate dehydrogenase [NAD(P)+]